MPDYRASFTYVDAQNGETRKSFNGTFADAATASAAQNDLLVDLQAATDAHIIKIELTEVDSVAGAPNAGSSVFEVVSATVTLDGKTDKANLQFPSPVDAMMSGNALDPLSGQWTNLMANFAAGAGWTVSDGDTVAGTVKGSRAYRASGSTNLPA